MSFRRKRFERGQPPANFCLQARDREILRDLAEYRFLSTDQILALYPTSSRNVRQRLQDLYHLGYLERPAAQKALSRRNRSLIYSLGEKGAEFLERRNFAKAKEAGLPYLEHAMMISQFRAVLSLALTKHTGKPRITRWIQGYELRDALKVRGEHPDLVPDAFFTIREGGELLDFFLEADRSTMTRERVLDKMKIYWRWYKEKRHQKILGLENFRVLTITISEARADNLREITKRADDRQTGSTMFLFLPETAYSLAASQAVLSSVWFSPKDGTPHALLE